MRPIGKDSSKVAQLRRLASTDNYAGGPVTVDPPSPEGPERELTAMISQTNLHADIRNFVQKEFVKSSATKELLRHIVFLCIFIAGVTLHRSVFEAYLMNQALDGAYVNQPAAFQQQNFVKTFLGIGQVEDFRDVLTTVIGATLDQDSYYSGLIMTPEERDYLLWTNRLLGGVRLRQLRAAPNKDCAVPHQLRNITDTCYSWNYADSNRETMPFGPPNQTTKYTYQSSSQCGSVGQFGNMLSYLEGGGYVVDVNLQDRDNGIGFTEKFQELINDTWIDGTTRAVIVTMNYLNIALDSRIAVLYLIIEIPGDGVLYPSFVIKTFRLDLYVVPLDYFRLFLEILFLIFVLWAIYSEGHEMYDHYQRQGVTGIKKYFYNGWNIIEIVDIVLYITVIILYAQYLNSPSRSKTNLSSRVYFPEMEQIAASALTFYNVSAVNVLLTTFRTFKYLRLNHRLYVLWKVLRNAGADLIGFLLIFLIFVFGFVFMGWLSFGADLNTFNTFGNSFGTCWNFLIGNPPIYSTMQSSNRVLGPVFFVLFTVFIFFILANMFIAILSNSLNDVVEADSQEKTKLKDIIEGKIVELIENVRKVYYRVTNKEFKKRSIFDILDELEHPEVMEQQNLTRDDVARAIGPKATTAEIDDLFLWIKKLEAKKNKKSLSTISRRSSGYEDLETDNPRNTLSKENLNKTLTKKQIAGGYEYAEMKDSLRDLHVQVKEMKQLLERVAANTRQ
jgi:polycystin 2